MANVKFEYLFLDIEWNQAPKTTDIEEREPVQIGIVAADANLNIKRTFSKSIRLSCSECFNPNTFTVSHYPLDAIMKSKSEETVLKNMNISFQNYKYIVVWTNETYELLKRRTDKYGISMPRHRVIILQQLLMQITGDGKKVIGFENHGGQTFDISNSFGNVLFGNGNKFGDSEEGFFENNVIATYLHGPLLSKNPELCDFIIKYCFFLTSSERDRRKTCVFQIYYIDCGRRLPLRVGRTEGFRRHPSASTGFRWSLADMIYCRLRTFQPISRAVLRKM